MSSQSLITASAAPSMPFAAGDAGVVDQDRDLPDLVGDSLRHREAVVALADVEHEALGLAAGIADFLGDVGRRLLVHVQNHHARALAGIAVGDRAPDAGARTGNDGDVVGEKGHGVSFTVLILAQDSKRDRMHKVVPRRGP